MKSFKNQIGWGVVLLVVFSSIAYASSSGTIGGLFNLISSGTWENGVQLTNDEYRLDGKNIQDGTVTDAEIMSGAITSGHIADGSIESVDLAPGIGGKWMENGTTLYYTTGSVGVGTSSPNAEFHVDGSIQGDKFIDNNDSTYKVDASGVSTLHDLGVTGITNTEGGLIINVRDSDPTNASTGQIWLRSDL